ncbi:YadA C-terminal domain-containing protein [Acinetobacter johnsonii]|uniref:YadA C-terminal domain-containing protein n=1 Tax=Acinetobacter johnsonii TaxID=40214 RepID=UPI001D18CA43|nr:YadA-like family protein [Acinetobacter johnsonii]
MNRIFTKVLEKSCCHMVVAKQNSQIEKNHMMKETALRISHRSNTENSGVVTNLRLTPKLLLLSIVLAMGNAAWATQGDNHQGQGQGHESHGNGNGYGHGSHGNGDGNEHGNGDGHGNGNGHGNGSGTQGPQGPMGPEGPQGADGTNGISPEVMAAADTNILNEAKTYVNQVGQQTLNQANAYTDSRVNALNRDMRKLEDRTYAAVASSIAIASLPQPTDAGYNMFSAGVGTWEGEQGYAFGLSGVTESNKYVYKVAVTTNSEGDFGAGAAIGWQWK